LSGATLRNPDGAALNLIGAEITGAMFADDDFNAVGEIRAAGAKIGGGVLLSGATLRNPDGAALNLDRAEITGAMFASDGFNADGEISAAGAKIHGSVLLNGASLRNPARPSTSSMPRSPARCSPGRALAPSGKSAPWAPKSMGNWS
jgi:uncharacterized protein YjbI with pentapeptide repeats